MRLPWRKDDSPDVFPLEVAEPVPPAAAEPAITGESVRLVPVSESPLNQPPPDPDADGGSDPAPLTPAPVPASSVKPTTLVIGEDDAFLSDEPIDPSLPLDGSGATKMDPRLRRRRIDVRRAAGRKRLVVVLTVGTVLVVVVAALAVLASPLFSVENVQVSGNVYTSAEELAPIIAEAQDQAILTLDTDAIARQLEQLPWVRRARVEADFPSTLKIELAERRPVAAYAGSDRLWRVIDRDGRVIAVIPDGAQPVDYLPIEGVGPDAVEGALAGDRYQVAGELAQSLPTELRNITAAITLGDLGTIGLRLTSDTLVDFGQPNDLRTKLAVLIALLRDDDPTGLASLNLSDPFNPGRIPITESATSGG